MAWMLLRRCIGARRFLERRRVSSEAADVSKEIGDAMFQGIEMGSMEGVAVEVEPLQGRECGDFRRQSRELVVGEVEFFQRGEGTDLRRQGRELVVGEAENSQRREGGDLRRQGRELVVVEFEHFQRGEGGDLRWQGGEAEAREVETGATGLMDHGDAAPGFGYVHLLRHAGTLLRFCLYVDQPNSLGWRGPRAGAANRPNDRFGSCADLRDASAPRLECVDDPTFTPERRQCGGYRTYPACTLNFGFVPSTDIGGARNERPLRAKLSNVEFHAF